MSITSKTASAQVSSKVESLQGFRDCPNCPEMVVVPAGNFLMGGTEDKSKRDFIEKISYEYTRPQHRVSVKSFAIGKYDVTKSEYAAFVKEAGYSPIGCNIYDELGFIFSQKASWHEPGFSQTDRDPVVCVSWDDAHRYVSWLNTKLLGQSSKLKADVPLYRLPSEAEWEYAARAGTTTSRFWGDDASVQCDYANGSDLTGKERYPDWTDASCRDGYVTTAPVGSFRPNPWGLYDMLGNVNQWIEDCMHLDYSGAPSDTKPWTTGECARRGNRGGGWTTISWAITSSERSYETSSLRESNLGFRLAKDLPISK